MSDQKDEDATTIEAEKVSERANESYSTDDQESGSAVISDVDSSKNETLVEEQLTEAELRHLYEEEEIERFLGLFADVSPCRTPLIYNLFKALAITSMLLRSRCLGRAKSHLRQLMIRYGRIETLNVIHLPLSPWITNGSQSRRKRFQTLFHRLWIVRNPSPNVWQ